MGGGETFCPDLALHWTQELEALGIKYNVCYMTQITELNLECKISDILGLIKNLDP